MCDPLDLISAVEFLLGRRICEEMYRRSAALLELGAEDSEIKEELANILDGLYTPHTDQVVNFLVSFSEYGDPYFKALLFRKLFHRMWSVVEMCDGDPEMLRISLGTSLSESVITRLIEHYELIREVQRNGPIYA